MAKTWRLRKKTNIAQSLQYSVKTALSTSRKCAGPRFGLKKNSFLSLWLQLHCQDASEAHEGNANKRCKLGSHEKQQNERREKKETPSIIRKQENWTLIDQNHCFFFRIRRMQVSYSRVSFPICESVSRSKCHDTLPLSRKLRMQLDLPVLVNSAGSCLSRWSNHDYRHCCSLNWRPRSARAYSLISSFKSFWMVFLLGSRLVDVHSPVVPTTAFTWCFGIQQQVQVEI